MKLDFGLCRLWLAALLLAGFCFTITKPVEAKTDDAAVLLQQMEQGGLRRRQAFWYAYQSKQYFLLRHAMQYFHQSNDYDDHRMLLRIAEVLGPKLDTELPGWYDVLDRYMTPVVPDDILIQCMKLAVKFKEHRLVYALTRMMRHPMYEVRYVAIQSLVAMENDNVVPVLIRFLKSDDPVLIIYGLEGSRVLGDARFVLLIRELLEHSNKSVRIYALKAIAVIRGEGDLSYLITGRFAREGNAEVRRTIIQLVGEQRITGQQYTVIRAMADSSPLVREAAYRTAASLQNSLFVRELSLRLTQETDVSLKTVLIESLVQLNGGDPHNGLTHILQTGETIPLRCLAARAVALLRDTSQAMSLFQIATTDADMLLRKETAYSLSVIAGPVLSADVVSSIAHAILDSSSSAASSELKFLFLRAIAKSGNRTQLQSLKNGAWKIKDPVLRQAVLQMP